MGVDQTWMSYALNLAQLAKQQGEVPVGAVIVRDNIIIGEGYNQPIATHDPTAHAEIQAIRMATLHDNNYRLTDCTLYVTLEPCPMCTGAIVQARIPKVVFGARDFKLGNPPNHKAQRVEGVLAQECSHLLTKFFADKRKKG